MNLWIVVVPSGSTEAEPTGAAAQVAFFNVEADADAFAAQHPGSTVLGPLNISVRP